MPAERPPLLPRLTLLLAALAVVLATAWALRTAPVPNSDRYDYLARAWHLTQGEDPSPLVVYPLRIAFAGAESLPATNLTRPPLWPAVLSMPMRVGVSDSAAVVCAALCLAAMVAVLARATPGGFGGFAALAVATGFTVWRSLLGGGPELALALLLLLVWTWTGSPQRWTRVAVLGVLLGLMPWLHPIGWLYAALGIGSRIWRDPPTTLLPATALALVIGLPWYVQTGTVTGEMLGPLQSHAELEKAVYDGGGLGPYRSLEGITARETILRDPSRFLRHVAHNLKEQLLHLDGWIAWPLLLIGLAGIQRDRWLAFRDLLLIVIGFVVVSATAFDPRLLTPLVPVAALWVGAGAASIHAHPRGARLSGLLPLVVVLPWLAPLGLTPRPGAELSRFEPALRDPDRQAVLAYGRAGTPGQVCFTDSSVLAWRSRRPGIAIPDRPQTLAQLRDRPVIPQRAVLIATAGPASWWFEHEDWADWWSKMKVEPLEGMPEGRVAHPKPPAVFYVPEVLSLGPSDVPDSLVAIGPPLAVREGLQLRPDALRSLREMADAALRDGVHLRVTSAYRSWDRQNELYANAVRKHGADQRWVAAPGTSEHQLGTTVDFCDAAMLHVLEPGFADTAEGRWLSENAAHFGWVCSYTAENEALSGYRPEPWHYRFGVPIDREASP